MVEGVGEAAFGTIRAPQQAAAVSTALFFMDVTIGQVGRRRVNW